jgi:GNAT superfamily N-acetyltransferase
LDATEEVYAVTCFGLRPEARGTGAAHRMMELVLADLRGRGVERVEGFPKKVGAGAAAGQVWTGPMGVFEKAGFERVREFERHWQMGRKI